MPSSIPYVDEVLSATTGCSGEGCPCAPNPQAETGADRKGRCWARALCDRFPKLHKVAWKERDECHAEDRYCGPTTPFSRVVLHPEALDKLAKARKPRVWLVSALGDLFDKQVPDEFIWQAMDWITGIAPDHTLLILTKQAGRMRDWFDANKGRFDVYGKRRSPFPMFWPDPRIWLGVSVTGDPDAWRIEELLDTPAAHRFVSYEPALSALRMKDWWLEGASNNLDWVVAGCESGPGARPCPTEWLLNVRQQCYDAGIPCFIKQARQWADGTGPLQRWPVLRDSDLPWTLAANRPRKPKAGAIR